MDNESHRLPSGSQSDSWRRIVLENALDAVIGMDQDQVIIDWNRQAELTFGWQKQEVIGKQLAEILVPLQYREAHNRGMRHFLKSGEGPILNHRIEIEALHRSGFIFPVELTVIPLLIEGRYLFYSFLRDITDRKGAESAVRESEERFRTHFEQAPFSIQILSPDGYTRSVNQAWRDLWGLPEDMIQNYILKEYNLLKDPQLIAKGIVPYIQKGLSGEATEVPVILYDPKEVGMAGNPRWVSAFIYPVRDKTGKITEVVLTHEDVTQAKIAEDALRRSSDQLQIMFEGVADGVLVQDRNFRCVYANEVGARLCGFQSAEAFYNASIPELLSRFELRDEGGNPLPVERLPARLALSGIQAPPETILRVKEITTGRETWAIVNSRPVLDSDGSPYLAVSIFRDITVKKLQEQGQAFLNEATQILSSSLDYNETLRQVAKLAVPRLADWCLIDLIEVEGPRSVAVAHHDPAKIRYAEELRSKYPPDWSAPTGSAKVMRTGKSELHSEIPDELLVRVARDEEHLRIIRELGLKSDMVVPLIANGKVLGTITFIAAESGRRYSERDLELAEELARRSGLALDHARVHKSVQEALIARDEFMSICSHELKTPVTSLKLQFEMAERQIRLGREEVYSKERVTKQVQLVNRQLDRMSKLIDDMLDVSRIGKGRFHLSLKELDLRALVNEVVERFIEQFQVLNIRFCFDCGFNSVMIRADEFRLEQVVSNLLTNAIKYGMGKPITMSLACLQHHVRLTVTDQGIGINKDALSRIFDPFERAVSAANVSGLGLGLYISREIVQAHGGKIWAESNLGAGSSFTVELPFRADLNA